MNTAVIQTNLQKLLPSLVGVSLVLALFLPHSVAAFFFDTESSGGERFVATELLLLPVSDKAATVTGTKAAGVFTADLLLTSDSTAANYDVVVTNTTSFCDKLSLQATSTEAVQAKQPLPSFASGTTSRSGMWSFAAAMDKVAHGLSEGSTCTATFTVTAWQDNMTKAAPGYFDATAFTVQFTYEEYEENQGASTETEQTTDVSENADDSEVQPGDVVINELMWMGSSAGAGDEWIELRNTTGNAVDISEWTIKNSQSGNGTTSIPANTTIPSQGVYLLAAQNLNSEDTAIEIENIEIENNLPTDDQWHQVSGLSLANDYTSNGAIALRNASNTLIDTTPTPDSSTWPHGKSDAGSARWSMQRGANPGDGSDSTNWYTCTPSVLQDDGTYNTMQGYWQAGSDINCGTPGRENLSSNDPTKPGYANWLASQNNTTSTVSSSKEKESNKKEPASASKEKTNEQKLTGKTDGETEKSAQSKDDTGEEEEPLKNTPPDKVPGTTTPPPPNGNTEEKEQQEDTNGEPVPEPDPVVKRSEEEEKTVNEPKEDDDATTQKDKEDPDTDTPPENEDDKKAKNEVSGTSSTGEQTNTGSDKKTADESKEQTDNGTGEEELVIDESGSSPNAENA